MVFQALGCEDIIRSIVLGSALWLRALQARALYIYIYIYTIKFRTLEWDHTHLRAFDQYICQCVSANAGPEDPAQTKKPQGPNFIRKALLAQP